jgi:circadian clock protein KaiC
LTSDRLSTGITEFDNLIESGIPRGYMILLAGTPGSGKTIFASQFLHEGLKANEPGIYVSFAEDNATFLRNMHKLEIDFEKYEKNNQFKYLDLVTVKEKGIDSVFERIFAEIHSIKAKRLVIDSISALNQAFARKIDARMLLHTVLGKISRTMGITTVLIAEMPLGTEMVGGGTEEFVADGVVVLTQHINELRLDRKLRVVKMRGTDGNLLPHQYRIAAGGIVVFPHPEIRFTDKVSSEKVETGIEGLDLMLEGGLFKGSTTKVAGSSGTGKTTLGLHFLYEGAKRNEKGLYVSFEEPVEQLLRHGEGFGWHLRQLAEEGKIKFVSYHPEPYCVEELLLQITNLIKEQKPSRIVIDSITKLDSIFPKNECMNYLLGLQSYTKNEEITTIMISVEEANSAANSRTSTLMDNIISLRHVEVESMLKRSLVIFKARGTAHDRDIREFEITLKGLIVKERFTGLEQVLGGAPRRTTSNIQEVAESWARAFGEEHQERVSALG